MILLIVVASHCVMCGVECQSDSRLSS